MFVLSVLGSHMKCEYDIKFYSTVSKCFFEILAVKMLYKG